MVSRIKGQIGSLFQMMQFINSDGLKCRSRVYTIFEPGNDGMSLRAAALNVVA